MIGVEKRDGRSEDFVVEKVVVSMVKSGAPADVAREIAKNIEAEVHEGISTRDIKRRVLEELRKKNPEWEENWLVYDRSVKKRT
jgi:transcriptional repressor NrdR